MKKYVATILILLFISFDYIYSTDLTFELINKVVLDSLINTVEELSGQKRVLINGVDTIIQKRNFKSTGNILASQYLIEQGEKYKYEISYQTVAETCTSVFWERKGATDSNKILIIGAHYDSENFDDKDGKSDLLSPGADDNASGVAAIIEIARILENYQPDFTIKFVFWDEEEKGSKGSKYYAKNAKDTKQNIIMNLNLDMLAWDSNNDGLLRLKYTYDIISLRFADSVVKICEQYKLKLKILRVVNDYMGFIGDGDWFWYNGFAVIGLADCKDYMERYHTQLDLIEPFNRDYFLENTKLAIAIISKFGYDQTTSNIESSEGVSKNISIYPNPASDFIEVFCNVDFTNNNPNSVNNSVAGNICIYNTLGETVMCTGSRFSESVRIDVSYLPLGLYFVRNGNKVNKFIKI